ncbi:MAG: DMT family transporter [Planctomycetota bacterium]|nr:DMT family transporter [Planctomycetota bacterium]
MSRRLGPLLALALAVLATSVSSILIRWANAPAESTAFWRVALAAVTFALLRPEARRGLWDAGAPAEERTRPWRVALLPGLLLAAHFATWIASLDHTSIAVSVLFVATQPLFAVGLAAVWLDERPRPFAWIGLLLAAGGTAVWFLGDPPAGEPRGAWLALAGGAAAAGYLVLGRRGRRRVAFAPYWLAVNVIAAAALAAWAGMRRAPFVGFSFETWLAFAALAWIPHLAGHGLYNWAVRRWSALAVNVAVLGEPVLAPLWAWWAFSERPGWRFAGTAAAVWFGILLVVRAETRDGEGEPE